MSRILATAATVTAVVLAPVVPAHAVALVADCPAVAVCMYRDYQYGGPLEFVYTRPAGTCVNLQSLRNQVTSFVNNSGRSVRLHFGSGCSGSWLERGHGARDGNLWINAPWANDDIESVRFL